MFEEIKEWLPFLIPLFVVQLVVVTITIIHILRHPIYKRGSRALWIVVSVVLMNSFIGPILYFLLGKGEAEEEVE